MAFSYGVLQERRERTSGAVEHARESISMAEAKTAEYENRLRHAKAEIFAAREKRMKQWSLEREQALAEARVLTTEKVKAGKAEIDQSVAAARQQIEELSSELSEQILRAILPPGSQPEVAQ
jgi:F-type H+-transporting ATPase subunit b